MKLERWEVRADSGRKPLSDATGLADAPGRTLPAGIPRFAGDDPFVPGALLYARQGGRSNVTADPALWPGRGDHLFRHPRGSRCPGPEGLVRGGRRSKAGAADRAGPFRTALPRAAR